MHGTSAGGNIFDTTYTDIYTLGIDATKTNLIWTKESNIDQGRTESLDVDSFRSFFTGGFNNITDTLSDWTKDFGKSGFSDQVLKFFGTSVLPSSSVFTFSNPHFDRENNLVVDVTYEGDSPDHA